MHYAILSVMREKIAAYNAIYADLQYSRRGIKQLQPDYLQAENIDLIQRSFDPEDRWIRSTKITQKPLPSELSEDP